MISANALVLMLWGLAAGQTARLDFDRSIAALLTSHCADCHSEKTKTSGFSVASLESVLAGGNKYGRAVLPGDPEKSPLVQLIRGNLSPRMPLGKTLAPVEITQIEDWIRNLPPEETAGRKENEWRWPFQKPIKHQPPTTRNSAWIRNPIDAFILKKLEDSGLGPASPARVMAGPIR